MRIKYFKESDDIHEILKELNRIKRKAKKLDDECSKIINELIDVIVRIAYEIEYIEETAEVHE